MQKISDIVLQNIRNLPIWVKQVITREILSELEKKLEALLQEQSELESKIADPETYADGYPAELIQHFEAVKADSEQMFEELSRLEEQIESLEAQRAELSVDGTVA